MFYLPLQERVQNVRVARGVHGVGDLLEVERERLAALVGVVETVLDHEGEPATDERAGARLARRTVGVKVKECLCEKGAEGKQNCKVENNDLRYETRHALVRLDVGCRVKYGAVKKNSVCVEA